MRQNIFSFKMKKDIQFLQNKFLNINREISCFSFVFFFEDAKLIFLATPCNLVKKKEQHLVI
jgi:hypothetical protein